MKLRSSKLLRKTGTRVSLAAAVVLTSIIGVPAAAAHADNSWYQYTGSAPLSSFKPGDILKSRIVSYHELQVAIPYEAVQLMYRTTDAMGRPAANVTSVLRPFTNTPAGVISIQSAYDSLNPDDSPSRAIGGDINVGGFTPQGNFRIGGAFWGGEGAEAIPMLLAGYTVVVPDTEGQKADFAAGPEYGMNTLDSLRAVRNSKLTGVSPTAKIGMTGYSGGAIATSWAAALAPGYAPEINKLLIGAASGGILVTPAHNLRYVDGSLAWAGVAGMALVGVARSYDIDFSKYLSPYGKQLVNKVQDASILNVGAQYPLLKWTQLVKPQYANPNSVPEYVAAANKINLGSAPAPTTPVLLVNGADGYIEGTLPGGPNIGPGDGVMLANDVRALGRQYCKAGTKVFWQQVDPGDHAITAGLFTVESYAWLASRFANIPAPTNCAQIPPGNSLAPEVGVPPAS